MKESMLNLKMLGDFSRIIESDCSEERMHNFLHSNQPLLICLHSPFSVRYDDSALSGALSKFPITTDRIPDFTLFCIRREFSNLPDTVNFLELKKTSARLYVSHGRMSKDLNDAWAESIESLRLIGLVYKDFIRRLQKRIKKNVSDMKSGIMPLVSCIVLIGRRSNLTKEEIYRINEVSACTNRTVRVMTYDSLYEIALDRLKDIERITGQHG